MEENLQMASTEQSPPMPQMGPIPSMASVQASSTGDITPSAQATVAQSNKQLKTSLICTLVLLFVTLTIFIGQTFAYFTDSSSSQQNRIASGNLDVSIVEMNGSGNFEWAGQPVKIMPASVFTIGGGVGIQNTGTLPMYVRVKVEKKMLQSENEMSPGWEDLISCNFMAGENSPWVYHEGYYYYKVALGAGERTAMLFDKVLFSPQMGNEFKNCSIQFQLICQSVQSNGNADNPVYAFGWPDESNESK